jgi:hypothetical protein
MSIDVPQQRSRILLRDARPLHAAPTTHQTGPTSPIVSAAKDTFWYHAKRLQRLIFGKPAKPDWLQDKIQEDAYRTSDYDHAPRNVAPRLPIVAAPKPYLNVHQRLDTFDKTLWQAVTSTAQMWWRRNPVDRAQIALRALSPRDAAGHREQLRRLSAFGPAAASAIPELLRILRTDEDPEVCMATVDALFALDPRAQTGEQILAVLFAKPKAYFTRRQGSGSQGSELTADVLAPAIFNHLRQSGVRVSGMLAEIISKDTLATTRYQALLFLQNWLENDTHQVLAESWDGQERGEIIALLRKRLAVDESMFQAKENGDFVKRFGNDPLTNSYDHNSAYELYQESQLIGRLLAQWDVRVDLTHYARQEQAYAAK